MTITPANAEAEGHVQAVTVLTKDVMRCLNTALPVGTVTARMHQIFGRMFGKSNINWWRMRELPVEYFENLVIKAVAELTTC